MSELVSLVVTVRPVQAVAVPGSGGMNAGGRAVYALLMRWLDEADPGLAQRWHDADGPKPFTCSSLVGAGRRALSPDQTYWLRLTSLDPALSAILLARQQHPPASIELDGVPLRVESLTTDPAAHPWAGATSYEQCAAPYLLAHQTAPRRLRLALASPTAFHQRAMNMPLPLPDLVFGGLADRWNAFSPVAISPEVRRYGAECVALNSFRLRSRAWPMKEGSLQVGAVGEAGYVAVTYDRFWMSLLALLADFAFYAGVGRMTTVGMGQARRTERAPA